MIEPESVSDDSSFIVDLEDLERGMAEQKLKLLKDMFPNADTVFLEAKCAELALDGMEFDAFLEDTMLRGKYPKQVEAQPAEPQQEPRIEEFNLDTFLKKYPEPQKHFENYASGDHYVNFSHCYLLSKFPYHSASVIRMELRANGLNLTKTHTKIAAIRPTRKIPRRRTEFKWPAGVPPKEYSDEAAYLDHQAEIGQYITDKFVAYNNAVEEARAANALLTCGCCFADDLLAEFVSNCSEGHIFCRSCILRSFEVLMGSGKLDFPCLQECSGAFTLEILKEIVPASAFEILEKKLQEREVVTANIPGLESCAFCEYAAIPPEESRIFDCANCMKKMCRLCRNESHIPFRCEEVKEKNELDKDRIFVEEKMTDALVRTCWRCNAKFIREDGCNKMVCVCGAMMCYICRQPIKDYSHFNEQPALHSKGDSRCPLWTNNRILHRQEVDEQGRKAIALLKRKNPELENLLYKKKR